MWIPRIQTEWYETPPVHYRAFFYPCFLSHPSHPICRVAVPTCTGRYATIKWQRDGRSYKRFIRSSSGGSEFHTGGGADQHPRRARKALGFPDNGQHVLLEWTRVAIDAKVGPEHYVESYLRPTIGGHERRQRLSYRPGASHTSDRHGNRFKPVDPEPGVSELRRRACRDDTNSTLYRECVWHECDSFL